VEEMDANARQKAINEVAVSTYLFQPQFLAAGVRHLTGKNARQEFYLTDLIAQAVRARKRIDVFSWNVPEDLRGTNTHWELAEAGRILNQRNVKRWAMEGVRIMDPASTFIESGCRLTPGVCLEPGVILRGETVLGRDVLVGAHAVLTDVVVGEYAEIKVGTVAQNSRIGKGAKVGPYAHLRPESVIGPDAKIGNFVEIKKSTIGEKTSIAQTSPA